MKKKAMIALAALTAAAAGGLVILKTKPFGHSYFG